MGIAGDIGFDRDAAIERCRVDMSFLGAVGIPAVFKFMFPPVFLAIWQLITSAAMMAAGIQHFCIGLPRGFGKTLVLKLYIGWLILFTDRRFILIVCNTATLAENFLADVQDFLCESNILRLFGDWRLATEKDTQSLKKFTFRGRPVTIAALGAGTSLRGLNIKYERPDVIIMDDMQSKEQAASEVESKALMSWMAGTLLKAGNKQRCLNIFVGNMYPYEGAIIKKLKGSGSWLSFIFGAILEDGESIWPELRSVDDILAELAHDESLDCADIFFSEVMNDDVAGTRAGVDISKFNRDQAPAEGLEETWEGGFIIIDPSLGKKKSDDVVVGAVLIKNGVPVLRQVEAGKFNPKQTVAHAITMAVKWNLLCIVVEAVAYQGTLGFWIGEKKTELGLHSLKILEINPEGEKKVSRIIDMLKMLISKEMPRIALHDSVRAQVQHQTIYWDPLKEHNKDDILDILAYIWKVMKKYKLLLMTWVYQVNSADAAFSDDLITDF